MSRCLGEIVTDRQIDRDRKEEKAGSSEGGDGRNQRHTLLQWRMVAAAEFVARLSMEKRRVDAGSANDEGVNSALLRFQGCRGAVQRTGARRLWLGVLVAE